MALEILYPSWITYWIPKEKDISQGGILLSASLLFGGLALTVMTIQNEEDEDE